ncbi:MAG: hypothetical protein JRN51_09525 [Nitrososphaerota archaeon]|nr:hypothetical protein [Nitrososphaerota archaeon]
MRRTSKYFWVGAAWVAFLVVSMFTLSFAINAYSSELSTIYVPQVSGAPNLGNPGSESFWGGVSTESVPLIPTSNYPPSGETNLVKVQMAWTNATGTPELVVKLQFPNVGSSPSYGSSVPVPVLNDTGNPAGRLFPMYTDPSCLYPYSSCYGGTYPQDTGFLQLAQGTQYSYPEQAMVIFGISPGANTTGWYQVSYKPKMVPGTSGALGTGSGGAAEIWLWSSNPTDNSSSDAAYPGMTFPNGTAVSTSDFGLPGHASYAIDGYTNSTSFYQIGGIPGSSQYPYINTPALQSLNTSVTTQVTQFMNPFMVQSHGVYDASSNTWTVEFVRALNTSQLSKLGENHYQLQMSPSSSSDYYIAFAITQGNGSETYLLYYNSVSFWWGFNFQGNNGFAGYDNQFGHPANPSP